MKMIRPVDQLFILEREVYTKNIVDKILFFLACYVFNYI